MPASCRDGLHLSKYTPLKLSEAGVSGTQRTSFRSHTVWQTLSRPRKLGLSTLVPQMRTTRLTDLCASGRAWNGSKGDGKIKWENSSTAVLQVCRLSLCLLLRPVPLRWRQAGAACRKTFQVSRANATLQRQEWSDEVGALTSYSLRNICSCRTLIRRSVSLNS